jgi:excisionase family DNA binding protein
MRQQELAISRKGLLIVTEVASICRVSERTVRHWITTGRLRSLRVGRRHLVLPEDVSRLFAARDDE